MLWRCGILDAIPGIPGGSFPAGFMSTVYGMLDTAYPNANKGGQKATGQQISDNRANLQRIFAVVRPVHVVCFLASANDDNPTKTVRKNELFADVRPDESLQEQVNAPAQKAVSATPVESGKEKPLGLSAKYMKTSLKTAIW